jgi:hypothetical protein
MPPGRLRAAGRGSGRRGEGGKVFGLEWLAANKEALIASVLLWFATNKDAVLAIAALASPLIAVAGAVWASIMAYRAAVTGPRTQLQIASDQFALTSRQIALQERSVALTEAQMSANLLGVADQKWIDSFSEALAELDGVTNDHWLLRMTLAEAAPAKGEVTADYLAKMERENELARRRAPLIAKIRLLVGLGTEGRRLEILLREWDVPDIDEEEFAGRGEKVFVLAAQIIEQKRTGIAARIAGVAPKS